MRRLPPRREMDEDKPAARRLACLPTNHSRLDLLPMFGDSGGILGRHLFSRLLLPLLPGLSLLPSPRAPSPTTACPRGGRHSHKSSNSALWTRWWTPARGDVVGRRSRLRLGRRRCISQRRWSDIRIRR
jgi:hypothetical protein